MLSNNDDTGQILSHGLNTDYQNKTIKLNHKIMQTDMKFFLKHVLQNPISLNSQLIKTFS